MDGELRTIAGGGTKDGDGPALGARLRGPMSVSVSSEGRIFFVEPSRHMIRELRNGHIQTIAGTGNAGFVDGPALKAEFNFPVAISAAADGNMYICDALNHRIRLLANGEVRTLAGTGITKCSDGPALQAQLNFPRDLAVSESGRVYICDRDNRRIRVLESGELRTVAGNGHTVSVDGPALQAGFNSPVGITLHPNGSIVICNFSANTLRYIPNAESPGRIRAKICLSKSSEQFTDCEISSFSGAIKLHKCLLRQRFPALFESPSMFEAYPIGQNVFDAFREFFYSDELPKLAPAKVFLGLAVR